MDDLRASIARLEEKLDKAAENRARMGAELHGLSVTVNEWRTNIEHFYVREAEEKRALRAEIDELHAGQDAIRAQITKIEKNDISTGWQLKALWATFVGALVLVGKTLFTWLAELFTFTNTPPPGGTP